MSGGIRLYRTFLKISSGSKTLIDPYLIEVETIDTSNNKTIENNIPITKETKGKYFADLNKNFYFSDIIYKLIWKVKYIEDSPEKELPTRFKISTSSISSDVQIEILDNNTINIEVE